MTADGRVVAWQYRYENSFGWTGWANVGSLFDPTGWIPEGYETRALVPLAALVEAQQAHAALLVACEGLLAFIRQRYPSDFAEGGRGYICPHHIAIDAALRTLATNTGDKT